MTKIRHLAFNDLQTNANNKYAPIAWADHSLWPQTAIPVLPTILTNEKLQMSINKAQDILLHRHSSNHLAIDHPDFLPIYDMFPEHGGIFVHISLLGLLSSGLNHKLMLVGIQKQQKRINWIQPHLNPQWLLATTIANIKHQDPFSLACFTTHEEPLPIWALYSHTA